MNKVAVAVAATLGITVAGIGTAQADEVLFPYIVTSSTVTTLVSTMNTVDARPTNAAPSKLHYRYWYKNGASAENNAAPCSEVDRPLPSSANDIVTIDVSDQITAIKGNLGIVFEDVKVSTLPESDGRGYGKDTFALLAGLTKPVRAFLVVDNNEFNTTDKAAESFFRTSSSIAGEAIVLEFANGAAWGYSAYNAAGRYDPVTGARTNFFDFSDYVETAGEVIAGEAGQGFVPVALAPRYVEGNPTKGDDIITKFFVTPIAPSTLNPATGVWSPPINTRTTGGQLRGDLTARVRLSVQDNSLGAAVIYDRDEGPVSGQVPQNVTCVGAIDALGATGLLSEGARLLVPQGGWSNLVVGGGTTNTNEAVVIKLEYNTSKSTSFKTLGIVNNAIWLRKGIKESIGPNTSFDANGDPVLTTRFRVSAFGADSNVTSSIAD
ncbi:MAG: hypothetical protein IPL99_01605 [Candidatus Competibacteraceae bacterium]|nr:hypothetical protein [Candidatus Competibacteraceae bacterium]